MSNEFDKGWFIMVKLWGEKRYNSLNSYLRKEFGEKAIKISIDAGFSCPNRDGKISRGGCIFCSEKGSGDFTGDSEDLVKQFYQGVEIMTRKWKNGKYIAYFQAYTNTYASVSVLREKYYSVLELDNVCGIAIATRPDCLDEDVIELLKEINKEKYLWVELGFQTSKETTAKLVNRGYENDIYIKATEKLKNAGIKFVTHIIFGLPGEDREDMMSTVEYVVETNPWGIKFHLLHLMKDTKLEEYYNRGELEFLSKEEYITLVVDALESIPEDVVIHRLTGDSPRKLLIGPMWSLSKWEILNSIDKELADRNTWQGKKVESTATKKA
jgi:uncharacterized protein